MAVYKDGKYEVPMSGFSVLGGWGGVTFTSRKFAHPPPPEKFPLLDIPHKSQPPPPTKQQFPSYDPTKTAFLVVVIAPASFLV